MAAPALGAMGKNKSHNFLVESANQNLNNAFPFRFIVLSNSKRPSPAAAYANKAFWPHQKELWVTSCSRSAVSMLIERSMHEAFLSLRQVGERRPERAMAGIACWCSCLFHLALLANCSCKGSATNIRSFKSLNDLISYMCPGMCDLEVMQLVHSTEPETEGQELRGLVLQASVALLVVGGLGNVAVRLHWSRCWEGHLWAAARQMEMPSSPTCVALLASFHMKNANTRKRGKTAKLGKGISWAWFEPAWLQERCASAALREYDDLLGDFNQCYIVALVRLRPGAVWREDMLQAWGVEAEFLWRLKRSNTHQTEHNSMLSGTYRKLGHFMNQGFMF
eukprot:6492190-Amphidinium_carterae.1